MSWLSNIFRRLLSRFLSRKEKVRKEVVFPIEALIGELRTHLRNKSSFHPNINLYEDRTWTEEEAKYRGLEFEKIVYVTIKDSLKRNPDTFTWMGREVEISRDSRVDFLLEWRIEKDRVLRAIVECKHSYSDRGRRDQLIRGKNQLARYRDRLPSANLFILLTDFRIPDSPKPFEITGNLLVVNFFIFPEVLKLINRFVGERKRWNRST